MQAKTNIVANFFQTLISSGPKGDDTKYLIAIIIVPKADTIITAIELMKR